jgi:hypothetical protein
VALLTDLVLKWLWENNLLFREMEIWKSSYCRMISRGTYRFLYQNTWLQVILRNDLSVLRRQYKIDVPIFKKNKTSLSFCF